MVKMPCRSNMSDLININKGKKMQEIIKQKVKIIKRLLVLNKELQNLTRYY
jgi:hypothetical protein